MKKKFWCFVLACVLLIGTLSGCSQSADNSSSADSSITQSVEESTPEEENSQASEEVAGAPVQDEPVTLIVMKEENASQVIKTDSVKLQYLEELLNIHIDMQAVPAASYEDKKKVLISTDQMPDIMKISPTDLRSYARQDMFVNLTEHKDMLSDFWPVYESVESMAASYEIDGSLYGFPILSRWSERGGQLPVIRTDLLEAYNLEVPTSFEELKEVLTVFKENNPDLVPLTNRKGGSTTSTQKVLDCMAYPLGSGSGMYFDEDIDGGRWVYGPADEHFLYVLSYLNELYEAGLMDPDYATMTVDQWKEKMSSGQALMYFDNAGFASDFNVALETIDPNYHLEAIPTLTNELGQTRNRYFDQHNGSLYVIATSSSNQTPALELMNWAYSEEGCDIFAYGKPGETFDYVDGEPVIRDELLQKFNSPEYNSPYYEIQSYLGVGLLDFTPYVDDHPGVQCRNYSLSDEERAEKEATDEMIANDPGMREPVYEPSLSEEDTERYNELKSTVENIVSQEWDKYIMGLEPIENYRAVIDQARAAGAEEMEQIYNNAYKAAQE